MQSHKVQACDASKRRECGHNSAVISEISNFGCGGLGMIVLMRVHRAWARSARRSRLWNLSKRLLAGQHLARRGGSLLMPFAGNSVRSFAKGCSARFKLRHCPGCVIGNEAAKVQRGGLT